MVQEASTTPNASLSFRHANGMVRVLLQLEGLFILVACIVGYYHLEGNWFVFFAGFFASDIFSFGYAFGPVVGCIMYNISHTFLGPILMLIIYMIWNQSIWFGYIGLIWLSHHGWERSLGYGLRYPDGFTSTHITVNQDPIEYVQNILDKRNSTVNTSNYQTIPESSV